MRRLVVFALFVPAALTLAPAIPAAAAATQVPMAAVAESELDVEVFMDVQAPKKRIDAVERRIRNSEMVRRFAHVSKRDAYREFGRIFKRNQELVDSIRPRDLPVSFRVDLLRRDDREEFARQLRKLEAVESAEVNHEPPTEEQLLGTIRHCQLNGDVDLEVFMAIDAAQAQIDAVVRAIGARPGLTVTRVLSKSDAYDEFAQIYASQPDLVDSITLSDLPVSIRVHATGTDPHDVVDRLEVLDGVDSVESPMDTCDEILKYLSTGVTPELLAHFLTEQAAGTPS